MTHTAVLLLSGGLDSAANLVLRERDFKVALALTIDYGQRSFSRELERSKSLCLHFGIEHEVLSLSQFSNLVTKGSSALLSSDAALPGKDFFSTSAGLDNFAQATKSAKAVWVPNRNGFFIALAAALAEARGIDAVAVGFNAEEAVTFADNSEDFMRAQTKALSFSTRNQVQIVSQTSHLTKSQIVAKLRALDFPFQYLWSCYRAGEKHCGDCESCLRLKRALSSAQVEWSL